MSSISGKIAKATKAKPINSSKSRESRKVFTKINPSKGKISKDIKDNERSKNTKKVRVELETSFNKEVP